MYVLKRLFKGLLSTVACTLLVLTFMLVICGPEMFGVPQLYWIHGAVAVIFCLWESGEIT